MVDSSDSNSGCFEIRYHRKPMTRKHDIDDDEEDISGTEAMLRRRKQPKKNTIPFVSSSPPSKMIWTKNNELVILKGIVDYENEKGFSYGCDWDVFYGYVKDLIDADFSKQQLINKVKKMKKRFSDNNARSGERLSFASTDDEEVFRLSMFLWGKYETESASNEENINQPKEVLVPIEDVPCAEHERGSDTRMEKDNKCQEEDGVDDFCVLQDALEAVTVFQAFGKNQQKMLCRNLENLPDQRKKELTDEWKVLLDEEMKLKIKKLTFAAKLANANA